MPSAPVFRVICQALLCASVAAAALSLPAAHAADPGGAQAAAVQSQDTNFAGIVADLTECKRKDGVLSVKVRLRNTSAQNVDVTLIRNRNYDDYYVTAGGKKYLVLRDTERDPVASQADGFGSLSVTIQKGGGYTWWAKYPAPPESETTISLVTPFAAPFEDVPISQ